MFTKGDNKYGFLFSEKEMMDVNSYLLRQSLELQLVTNIRKGVCQISNNILSSLIEILTIIPLGVEVKEI